jgi:lactoylglutathione lyase
MREYRYHHVHLLSSDPDATARFFETMFGAELTRSVYPPGTLYPGQQRITMRLGGQTVIAPPHPHEATATPPPFPHYGLEHIGLTVDDVDAAVEELRAKGGLTEDEVVPRRLLVEHLVDPLPIIPSRRAKQLNLQIAVDRRKQDDEHSMMPAAA